MQDLLVKLVRQYLADHPEEAEDMVTRFTAPADTTDQQPPPGIPPDA